VDDSLKDRITNQIFKFEASIENAGADDAAFTLDFSRGAYRQDDLVGVIRDAAPYFSLTQKELSELDMSDINRRAFTRISDANRSKKGDYGELLLYIVLSIFYNAPKFVTKARLRSSTGEQIKGFDCAHFTIQDRVVTLWLGEAKFHKSFSDALTSALESLNDHLESEDRIRSELKILGGEIEINKQLESENYRLVKSYVEGGRSIDNIPICVPVLLTYDSTYLASCNGNTIDIRSGEFKEHLAQEFKLKFRTIYSKSWPDYTNIRICFFLIPFSAVDDIKSKLEMMEEAMKF